jgi:hypothetical protein
MDQQQEMVEAGWHGDLSRPGGDRNARAQIQNREDGEEQAYRY